MVQEDVIINVKYKDDKKDPLKNVKKSLTSARLSMMFFAYSVEKAFQGLIGASMDFMGVQDVMNSMLGTMFLPIAEVILDTLLWIWDMWDTLPEPVQKGINALMLIVGVGAAFVGVNASLGLFIKALTDFGIISTATGAVVSAAFGAIFLMGLILIGALWALDAILKWLGFPGLYDGCVAGLKRIWEFGVQLAHDIKFWFTQQIPEDIATLTRWFQNMPNNVNIAINNLVNFISIGVNKILDFFRNLPINISNAITNLASIFTQVGRNMIQWIINGINSMASSIKNAFWNLLPTWLQNAISGVGKFAKSILNLFGGLFGMQQGGIVTRPTPALIGERGPEAVIPLDRIGSIGGVYVTINTSTIGGNTDSIAREIADKFAFELSRVRY